MSVLNDLYELLTDHVATPVFDSRRLTRAAEALDGLLIYGAEATEYCQNLLLNDPTPENVGAALILGDCSNDTELMRLAWATEPKTPELWKGIGIGLRLCRLSSIWEGLHETLRSDDAWGAAIAYDALLFHRIAPDFDPRQLLQHDDACLRSLTVTALGRSTNAQHACLLSQSLSDSDPIVRRDALIAAARCGLPELSRTCCTLATASSPCLSSVRFLGVIALESDIRLIRKLAESEDTAAAAVEAMGRWGSTEIIPDLLAALSNPTTADAASHSLERITGRLVPRSDPPPPPDHLTEEELDFWFHPGDPIPDAALRWWDENHYYFDRSKRYQAGVCVSDDPLGPQFETLPDEIRTDLYLRQRALVPFETPDWELETWPGCCRHPQWANSSRV